MQATLCRRRRALFVLIAALSVALVGLRPAAATLQVQQASTSGFIVLLNDGVDPEDVMDDHPGAAPVEHVYKHAVKGFAGAFSSSERTRLQRDPRVRLVERDRRVRVNTTQTGAPWGLDRIDQVPRSPLSGTYTYLNTGAGVTAYVIDTGIRYSHNDFDGASPNRAVKGFDAVTFNGNASDCHGHGTHVAGTIGGTTYGVAKAVKLVSVRVLGCTGYGSLSGVIAGVDWVTANHQKPAVANMSLGAGKSPTLDAAVANSIEAGVSYAIAAGNGNFLGFAANACNQSPARVPAAMTVGATDKNDTKASWSNYGSCVDWFAPGVSILSAGNSGDSSTATMSGTSMAAPHTAGVAALYLDSVAELADPALSTPAAVRTALFDLTLQGIVKSSRTTNNNNDLLFKGTL